MKETVSLPWLLRFITATEEKEHALSIYNSLCACNALDKLMCETQSERRKTLLAAVGILAVACCVCVHLFLTSFHFFTRQAEGEDSLKKMQLMELAILNGTYRDANIKSRKPPSPLKQTEAVLFEAFITAALSNPLSSNPDSPINALTSVSVIQN